MSMILLIIFFIPFAQARGGSGSGSLPGTVDGVPIKWIVIPSLIILVVLFALINKYGKCCGCWLNVRERRQRHLVQSQKIRARAAASKAGITDLDNINYRVWDPLQSVSASSPFKAWTLPGPYDGEHGHADTEPIMDPHEQSKKDLTPSEMEGGYQAVNREQYAESRSLAGGLPPYRPPSPSRGGNQYGLYDPSPNPPYPQPTYPPTHLHGQREKQVFTPTYS